MDYSKPKVSIDLDEYNMLKEAYDKPSDEKLWQEAAKKAVAAGIIRMPDEARNAYMINLANSGIVLQAQTDLRFSTSMLSADELIRELKLKYTPKNGNPITSQ